VRAAFAAAFSCFCSALSASMAGGWEPGGVWGPIALVGGGERAAPRPLGTKMAVNDFGEIAGGVPGGCVQGAVIEIAERVIHREEPELTTLGIADEEAWGVGLPCGGEIAVWVERHAASEFLNIAQDGGRAVEVTVLPGHRRRQEAARQSRRDLKRHARHARP
jgi:xanthine dehydrogenase accessory factor